MVTDHINLVDSSSDEDELIIIAKEPALAAHELKGSSRKRIYAQYDDSDSDDIPMHSTFATRRQPLAVLLQTNINVDTCKRYPDTNIEEDSSSDGDARKLVDRRREENERASRMEKKANRKGNRPRSEKQHERAQQKEEEKLERQKTRDLLKQSQQQERLNREREKQRRAEQREREKLERKQAMEILKQSNRDRKIAAQQATGKFSNNEIALVVHPHLLQAEDLEETFSQFRETYGVIKESEGGDKRSVQMIRRDFLAGGAKEAIKALENNDETEYQLVNRLVLVFSDPDDFLKLMERVDVEDDYPKLEEWLEEVYAAWRKKWNRTENPKVMILLPRILEEIHCRWNAASRAERNKLPTDTDINDAIVWLHIAFRVECQPMSSFEQVSEFLIKMTRAVSEEPYVQQVTELDCVRKIKSNADSSATSYEKASDVWIRMLQQVPRISATRAEHLAQYYPTARSLWQAYQQTQGDKAMLVAHLLGERAQLKLSEHLSRVMTGNNPNEFLN